MDDDARRDLIKVAWAHIDAERSDQAEPVLRKLIEQVDPEDALSRWQCLGLLAGVLNSLDRPDEGTEMYRRALTEAERLSRAVRGAWPSTCWPTST